MAKPNTKEKENLDFEISFYEDLLKDRPDFLDALILLGDAYTRRGFYKKGLSIDKRLAILMANVPIVNYNLACSYSLVGDIDSSLRALSEAIEKGYRDFDFMKEDPDLENVRKDKRFKELISKPYKKKGGDINGIWFIKEEKGKKRKEKGCEKKSGKKGKTAKKENSSKKESPARYSSPKR